LPEVVHIASD
jgi:hypothetical protein